MRIVAYYAAWLVLSVALLNCVYHSVLLMQHHFDHFQIQRLADDESIAVDDDSRAAVRLAHAAYLKRHQRFDEALAVLGALLDHNDPQIAVTSRYNLGNLYLSRAIEAASEMQVDDAMTMAELAKKSYRRALHADSRYWDAKYNLEVAMRLMPEMDRVTMIEEEPAAKKSKPWTTIPGFPRGLP